MVKEVFHQILKPRFAAFSFEYHFRSVESCSSTFYKILIFFFKFYFFQFPDLVRRLCAWRDLMVSSNFSKILAATLRIALLL